TGPDDQTLAVGKDRVVTSRITIAGRGEPSPPGQRGGDETVVQLDRRRREHRFRVRRLDLHDRARLLAAGRHDAPGPAQIDAGRHGNDTVREQGRGERVTDESGQPPAVEGESDGAGAVDESGAVDSHGASPDRISWVTVSRTTENQRRQPA